VIHEQQPAPSANGAVPALEETRARLIGLLLLLVLIGWGAWAMWGTHGVILIAVWIAWWLGGVNWRRAWPALASGGWAPVVLLMVVTALIWSRLDPSACNCLGIVTVSTFWWQLGDVGMFVGLALLCGWLQGVFGWAPPEVNLEPPVHADHDHGHGHH
jgi:hypothetical protein